MKSLKDMTPEELRELADQKENGSYRASRKAKLKHDLFSIENPYLLREYLEKLDSPFTKKQLEEVIEVIRESSKLVLKKGTVFVSFGTGKNECWSDNDGGYIEEIHQEWADGNLTDFKDVK